MGMGYFFSILASMQDSLSFFKYLNPFSYYGTNDLIVNTEIQGIYFILTISIIAIAIFVSYMMFSKKDIKV